jgi:hypothetical protein
VVLVAALAGIALAIAASNWVAARVVEKRLRAQLPQALEAALDTASLTVSWDRCSFSIARRTVTLSGFAAVDSSGRAIVTAEEVSVRALNSIDSEELDLDAVTIRGARLRVAVAPGTPRERPGMRSVVVRAIELEDVRVDFADPKGNALAFAIDRADVRGASSDPLARGVPIAIRGRGAVLDTEGKRALGGSCDGSVDFASGRLSRAQAGLMFEDSKGANLGGAQAGFTRTDEGTARTVAHAEAALRDASGKPGGSLAGDWTFTPAFGAPCEHRYVSFKMNHVEDANNHMEMTGNFALVGDAGDQFDPRTVLADGIGRLPGLVATVKEKLEQARAGVKEVGEKVAEIGKELEGTKRELEKALTAPENAPK